MPIVQCKRGHVLLLPGKFLTEPCPVCRAIELLLQDEPDYQEAVRLLCSISEEEK